MQPDLLLPARLSAGGIQKHVLELDSATLVSSLASEGYKLVELGGDLALFVPQAFAPPVIQRLAELKALHELSYTVHLPLWSIEPSTSFTHIRDASVRTVAEIVEATLPLAPEIFVMHATGSLAAEFARMRLPPAARGPILRQFQRNAHRSLRALLDQTGIASRRLAIETIEFPFDLTLELAEELDLSICFDTGHVLVGFSGPIDLFEALDHCRSRLGEIHLHDGPWYGRDQQIGYGKDHQPLGAGDLDVPRLVDWLEVNFDGPVVFELTVAQARTSINVIHAIRPAAIVNFNALRGQRL